MEGEGRNWILPGWVLVPPLFLLSSLRPNPRNHQTFTENFGYSPKAVNHATGVVSDFSTAHVCQITSLHARGFLQLEEAGQSNAVCRQHERHQPTTLMITAAIHGSRIFYLLQTSYELLHLSPMLHCNPSTNAWVRTYSRRASDAPLLHEGYETTTRHCVLSLTIGPSHVSFWIGD